MSTTTSTLTWASIIIFRRNELASADEQLCELHQHVDVILHANKMFTKTEDINLKPSDGKKVLVQQTLTNIQEKKLNARSNQNGFVC